MSAKRNFYLGLFVVCGFALMIAAVFIFGVASFLRPKAYLVTSFTESVQGLDIGSVVKYKGVPVGSVKKITLDMKDQLIMVLMEVKLDTLAFGGEYEQDGEALFAAFIREAGGKGLRCHLEYSGITGMKYVEMNYMPDGKYTDAIEPLPLAVAFPEAAYLPSAPSAISDMLTTLNASLESIAAINFTQLSNTLDASLVQLENLLANPEIPLMMENLRRTSASLEMLTANLNNALTPETLTALTTELQTLLRDLSAASEIVTTEIRNAGLDEVSESLQQAMKKIEDTQRPILYSLEQIDNALEDFDALVRQLSLDPGSLLRGSSVAPVDLKELER